ncbi:MULTISPECIES: CcmD family protein [Methanococcoides]
MALGIQAFQTAFVITWIVLISYIIYLIYNRSQLVSKIRKLK